MGLFPEAPKDLHGTQLATQLCQALAKERKITYSPNIADWGREFDKLLTKVPEARVRNVLDWYTRNISRAYTARAFSALAFRQKFEQIEACIVDGKPPQEAGEEYKLLAEKVARQNNWPAEVLSHLPLICKQSRAALADFVMALIKVKYHGLCDVRGLRFVMHVLEGKVYPTWVEDEWLPYQHERVGWLERYTGRPLSLCFTVDSEQFRDGFWRRWSLDWCGDCAAFDNLLTLVTTRP